VRVRDEGVRGVWGWGGWVEEVWVVGVEGVGAGSKCASDIWV
jgi:hypothetical protein